MERLSRLIFIFALLFTVLIITPAFLSAQFGPYSLIKTGDVLDLLTALILLPLYWLLFQLKPGELPKQGAMIAFMVFAGAWASGQGMHLSANSIGHLLAEIQGSDIYTLTHFYDEVLSHYIWHTGIVGLSALLIFRQWKHPFDELPTGLAWVILGGLLYGLTYFSSIIEAGTAPLGIPFALATTVIVLIWGRKGLNQKPLVAFFLVAYLLALILFAVWAIIWRGLPEFSEVGLL